MTKPSPNDNFRAFGLIYSNPIPSYQTFPFYGPKYCDFIPNHHGDSGGMGGWDSHGDFFHKGDIPKSSSRQSCHKPRHSRACWVRMNLDTGSAKVFFVEIQGKIHPVSGVINHGNWKSPIYRFYRCELPFTVYRIFHCHVGLSESESNGSLSNHSSGHPQSIQV